MSLMLRNFEYLAGGTANGQYPGDDLNARIADAIEAAIDAPALRLALGIGSYADDAAATTAGLAAGEMYYNTTSDTYVLVQPII